MPSVPTLFLDAGEKASWRLIEFFTANIRNRNLNPKMAQAHAGLGTSLLQLGYFAEARASTLRSLELLPRDDPFRQSVTQQLHQCDQLLAMDQKLSTILEGKEKPADEVERLALARFCQQPFTKRYVTSFHFYVDAFANNPSLADNIQKAHRYNAACAAALAGCGLGNDADKLGDKERARLRKQAVEWLRADLDHWTKQSSSQEPKDRDEAQKTLKHWRDDTDLAGIRDNHGLAILPADERRICQKLWADVEELLMKTNDSYKRKQSETRSKRLMISWSCPRSERRMLVSRPTQKWFPQDLVGISANQLLGMVGKLGAGLAM